MYKPVDRKSRMLETLFERGQRARPVVPPPAAPPRPARRCVAACAPRPRRAPTAHRLRHEYLEVFAEDRRVLEGLGIDVDALGPPDRRPGG